MTKIIDDFKSFYDNKQLSTVAKGSNKTCYLAPGCNKVYLVTKHQLSLKNVKYGLSPNFLNYEMEKAEKLVKISQKLKKLGVNVVEVETAFKHKDILVEVQEQAKGKLLNIYFKHTGELLKKKSMCDMPLNDFVFDYNHKMQKQLIDAPQQHFDKMVNDYITCANNGVYIVDSHPENMFYCPDNGFTFLDLPFDSYMSGLIPQLALSGILKYFSNCHITQSLSTYPERVPTTLKNHVTTYKANNFYVYKKLLNSLIKHNLLSDASSIEFFKRQLDINVLERDKSILLSLCKSKKIGK